MILTYPMQMFVARHVLAKIFYNGDTEGSITGEDGTKLPPPTMCFCLGRLQQLTLGIYVAALIPALIFNDLGPVLSITGAIGGSSLAYIGPGLVYLGVHGEYFLQYTNEMMGVKQSTTDPTIELPTAGDATATITMPSTSEPSLDATGSAPWWWCLVLMPVWRAIAADGNRGMKLRLEQLEEESPGCTTVPPSGEVVVPENSTFYLAMFLVTFGLLAVVAGVISNVMVQVSVH